MDQVSKPVLIALAAVLVFVVAHFTILAPKSDSGGSAPASATAPGQAGLESAIDKANHAVGTNNAAVKRHEQAAAAASGDASASGQATTKPSATTASGKAAAAKPAAPAKPKYTLEAGDKSGPILADLDSGKVVVALFYNAHGSDDNAALRAVRASNRHHGKVVVHSIPIDDVGDYDALTTDVQILQAPTILVIGPDHKARTIVGYTEVKEVEQTVGDVGGKGFEATAAKHLTGFIGKAVDVCDGDVFSVTQGELPASSSSVDDYLGRAAKRLRHSRARMAKIPASGAKQVAAKRALLAAYGGYANTLESAAARIRAGGQPTVVVAGMVRAGDTITKHYAPALHAVHDHHCLA